ncbi:MAG: CCA tRNA nucleotidyltransferase [Oscillospiraceae bacterium]|nr:CCA tRNA nucleotidyltransferase [Oscillospiraceae bacterium]
MTNAEKVLHTLSAAGYETYFVGGCVRDTLLGRPVHDRDIATAALPEQVMALFPKCVPTGLKHGTVTVLEGGEPFEVTTFRCDGSYHDGRHPDAVAFVRELREDLSRRDFTVNAMAMDLAGNVTDLFGGREDLKKKIIRCVGDPATRFGEDALRMLRAFRFSAQLGFTVEPKTLAAIQDCAPLCTSLSAERVRDEVEKTLLSPAPETVGKMAAYGLLAQYHIGTGDLTALRTLPCERAVRWAGCFRADPDASWADLRLDKKTGKTASRAAQLAGTCQTRLDWKRLLSREGEDTARVCAALTGDTATVEEILRSGECLYLRDLAVGGDDLASVPKKRIGGTLWRLLDHVLEHPGDNTREKLLKLL